MPAPFVVAACGGENVIDRGDLAGGRLDQAEGNQRGVRADRVGQLLQGDGLDGGAAVGVHQPREQVRGELDLRDDHPGAGGSIAATGASSPDTVAPT